MQHKTAISTLTLKNILITQTKQQKKLENNILGTQCETSPADIAQSWRPLLVHQHRSECRCTCQIGLSCHSELFSHFQMLNNEAKQFTNKNLQKKTYGTTQQTICA